MPMACIIVTFCDKKTKACRIACQRKFQTRWVHTIWSILYCTVLVLTTSETCTRAPYVLLDGKRQAVQSRRRTWKFVTYSTRHSPQPTGDKKGRSVLGRNKNRGLPRLQAGTNSSIQDEPANQPQPRTRKSERRLERRTQDAQSANHPFWPSSSIDRPWM